MYVLTKASHQSSRKLFLIWSKVMRTLLVRKKTVVYKDRQQILPDTMFQSLDFFLSEDIFLESFVRQRWNIIRSWLWLQLSPTPTYWCWRWWISILMMMMTNRTKPAAAALEVLFHQTPSSRIGVSISSKRFLTFSKLNYRGHSCQTSWEFCDSERAHSNQRKGTCAVKYH